MPPGSGLPAVEYAERSDPGRDPEKQVNEDACGRRETRFGHLCVVCDGMGGHAAGREAAELALGTIFETFESAPEGALPGPLLRASLEEASRRIFVMHTSEIAMGRPGSTVVAVLMHSSGTEVAHVGDSRAYLVQRGQIARLTRDHSIVQEMIGRGLLTVEQARHHPDANRITRALGMAEEVEVELAPQPVHHVVGDAFVLCSDGLSDLVEDHEILEVVGGDPAAQAVGKLVDIANARGGHDNITVIVLRARETALPPAGTLAPTMAQTSVGEVRETVPGTGPAILAVAADSVSDASAGVAALPRGIPTTAPPSSVRNLPARRGNLAIVAAVLLAVAAVVLLSAVLLEEFTERRGKRNARTTLGLPALEAGNESPTELVPENVVLPSARPHDQTIAPLEPPGTTTIAAPGTGKKRKH